MAFKVEYYKLAKTVDGSVGNINQGNGIVYTNNETCNIEVELNTYLGKQLRKTVCVITKITKVDGVCI